MKYIFLDGVNTGTPVEEMTVKASLAEDEGRAIKKMMRKAGAESDKGELYISVPGKSSSVRLSLRAVRGKTFLNLSGNPLTFYKKSNVFGLPEADKQIIRAFTDALRHLEERAQKPLPKGLGVRVASGDLFIHSLEFAAYTKPIEKARYLSAVQHVYGQGLRDAQFRTSITSMLKIRITQNYDNQTIGIGFMYGGSYEKKLLVYDKEAELLSKGYTEVPDFVKNRLRFDLQLDPAWFARRKIRTVREFADYAGTRGGEAHLIADEITKCVRQACLEYMFTIRREDLREWQATGVAPPGVRTDIDYDTHLCLWAARQLDLDREVLNLLVDGRAQIQIKQEEQVYRPSLTVFRGRP